MRHWSGLAWPGLAWSYSLVQTLAEISVVLHMRTHSQIATDLPVTEP